MYVGSEIRNLYLEIAENARVLPIVASWIVSIKNGLKAKNGL